MKIYTRTVWDMESGELLEEESFEYEGPLTLAGGGGGGGDTTTIQKADPWAGQQPYLTDVFSQAQNLYYNQQPQPFPESTVAPFNPIELEGQASALTAAYGPQANIAMGAEGANQFLMGDVLKADTNPYMADYAAGAIRPIFDELTRRALPEVRGGALNSGQVGGSRQGIAEGLAISDATQQAYDTTSRMYSDAYGQNLDALTKGLALAPGTQQMALAPAQTISGVGAQQRAMEQAMLDDVIKQYTQEQSIPWDALAAYQGLVQGTFGGTGTSSVSGGDPSTAQNLLGAAGAGLSTYTGLSTLGTGIGGATGAAIGAAAPWAAAGMALLSLF